jgi:hypothetical protein
MAEVDYGYGDQDYGYEDAGPDMGYGEASPGMGYGDASPDMGYGSAAPDSSMDYGYGDATPDMDYGYGDASPDPVPAPKEDKRPKRRCSVTKFSLATETPLTAASVINDLRMGLPPPQSSSDSLDNDCAKSIVTDETRSDDGMKTPPVTEEAPKKNGMISRIRRRLSIVS